MTICLKCNKELKKSQKKFCSSSCAASYNNTIAPKRTNNSKTFECLKCSTYFSRRPSQIEKGHTSYCSLKCMHDHKRTTNREELLKGFEEGKITSRRLLRRILFERDGNCCSVCNLTEWRGHPIPLWLDHIDGCALNNNPSNLRLICLNCDALNETFGAKNKGKGRRSLGLKSYG